MDDENLTAALRTLDEGEWDDRLAIEVAGELVDRMLARAARVVGDDAPLWERLEVHAGALIGALERNLGFAAALLERAATPRSTTRLASIPLATRIAMYLYAEIERARDRGEISRFTAIETAAAELWGLCGRVVLSWARDRSEGSIETQRRARSWIADLVRSWGGAAPEPPA